MRITTPARRLSAIFTIALLLAGLGACNTMQGAGQDIEAAGQAVEDTAEDASN